MLATYTAAGDGLAVDPYTRSIKADKACVSQREEGRRRMRDAASVGKSVLGDPRTRAAPAHHGGRNTVSPPRARSPRLLSASLLCTVAKLFQVQQRVKRLIEGIAVQGVLHTVPILARKMTTRGRACLPGGR